MKITNKYDLPKVLVSAVENDSYTREPDVFSVTELINPPQLVLLNRRYDNVMERDVSDSLWLLLGQAMHSVLERADSTDAMHEQRLRLKLKLENGEEMVVSGQADRYENGGLLADYKVTSVWSYIYGDKPEWERQLNLYAYMYRKHGFPVTELEIHAILRDWRQSEAYRGGDYPPVPYCRITVPVWSEEDQRKYLLDRATQLRESFDLDDSALPPCTPQEMWEEPTKYAVMKPGRKSAVKVCEDNKQAFAILNSSKPADKCYIQTRPGTRKRCDNYCSGAPFCHQYAAYQETKEAEAAPKGEAVTGFEEVTNAE